MKQKKASKNVIKKQRQLTILGLILLSIFIIAAAIVGSGSLDIRQRAQTYNTSTTSLSGEMTFLENCTTRCNNPAGCMCPFKLCQKDDRIEYNEQCGVKDTSQACILPGQKSPNANDTCCPGGTKKLEISETFFGGYNRMECVPEVDVPNASPVGQCFFGTSSCSSLNRVTQNDCNDCPSSVGSCCGEEIEGQFRVCVPNHAQCVSQDHLWMCNETGTEKTDIYCDLDKECFIDHCVPKIIPGNSCSEPDGTVMGPELRCCAGEIKQGTCGVSIQQIPTLLQGIAAPIINAYDQIIETLIEYTQFEPGNG